MQLHTFIELEMTQHYWTLHILSKSSSVSTSALPSISISPCTTGDPSDEVSSRSFISSNNDSSFSIDLLAPSLARTSYECKKA